MSIHSFIVVRKILTLPLYTLSMRTFLTVQGSYGEKRQKFLTNSIQIRNEDMVFRCKLAPSSAHVISSLQDPIKSHSSHLFVLRVK